MFLDGLSTTAILCALPVLTAVLVLLLRSLWKHYPHGGFAVYFAAAWLCGACTVCIEGIRDMPGSLQYAPPQDLRELAQQLCVLIATAVILGLPVALIGIARSPRRNLDSPRGD